MDKQTDLVKDENGLKHSRQISGKDDNDNLILSVLAKRTYQIRGDGSCRLHDIQAPLIEDQVAYADNEDLFEADTDLYPYKKLTDIVIKGKARNYAKSLKFVAQVAVANTEVSIMVIGDRKPYLSATKKILFSDIKLIDEVPLKYDFAYGGCDVVAEKKLEMVPYPDLKGLPPGIDFLVDSPYRYPRNPLGKGYIVELNDGTIEKLELPNLEDPADLLSPDNILVGKPERWMEMPIPRGTDWFNPTWFPRLAYFGLFEFGNFAANTYKEVKKNWADLNIAINKNFGEGFDMRCANGASLGLQISYLKPGSWVRLKNIHPQSPDFKFQLPTDYPEIWVDGRNGKLLSTRPVMQTVLIEPDENRLCIVWRGSAPAIRPYLEIELEKMPFKIVWNKL